MDPNRFDTLARSLTATLPRRGLLGLAALALPDAAAARKRKKKCKPACGPCTKCVKGRCAPDVAQDGDACGAGACRAGTCVTCPAGQWGGGFCLQGQCCPDGQVCEGAGCATCPPQGDFCATPTLRGCGSVGDGATPDCACVTSRQGTTTCSSLYAGCFPCTTDAQCTAVAGVPAVCVEAAECGGCQNGSTLCMVAGCVPPPPSASARSAGLAWRRIEPARARHA